MTYNEPQDPGWEDPSRDPDNTYDESTSPSGWRLPDELVTRMTGTDPERDVWSISVDRVNPAGGIFSSYEPVATIAAREEGSRLDTIYIQGPGNRALAISIELGEGSEPIGVRVTEDGYGFSREGEDKWTPASDGGDAWLAPISRADMEVR